MLMFERFSDPARRVIFFARYEASQFRSPAIDTVHLLLGMLRESHQLITLLAGSDAVKGLMDRIRQESPVGKEKISLSADLPVSEAAIRVLQSTAEEADQLGSRTIKPEHLLLGLFRDADTLAARILQETGLDYVGVRKRLEGIESSHPG